MGKVNDWVGTIGGTILGIELIVLLLLAVALNAVLAFVLWWVLRKTGWVHEKITWLLGIEEKAVNRVAGVAAAPVIRTTSAWRGLKAGLHRATHWPHRRAEQPALPPMTAVPSQDSASRAA